MLYFNMDAYLHNLEEEVTAEFAASDVLNGEWEEWRRSFRTSLAKLMGLEGMRARYAALPLGLRIVEQTTETDYTIEKGYLTTEPGIEIPFYLLLPRRGQGPYPLVLAPHGHGRRGKEVYVGRFEDDAEREDSEDGERDIALQAVREGYACIAMDVRGFWEMGRKEEHDAGHADSCKELQRNALMFGRTLIGERVHDMGRLIDYAATRPEIDISRIAITGNSGGGTVSLFTAALDERITVCVPGSYFCTFRESIMAMHHCACNYVPGILKLGEMYDVAALVAPRPILFVNGKLDEIYPIDATQRAFAKLQATYAAMDAQDRCALYIGSEGHRYYKTPVWPFIAKHFGV